MSQSAQLKRPSSHFSLIFSPVNFGRTQKPRKTTTCEGKDIFFSIFLLWFKQMQRLKRSDWFSHAWYGEPSILIFAYFCCWANDLLFPEMSLPGSLSINQSLVQAAFILPSLLPIMWFALRERKAGKYRPRKTKREKLPGWLTCSFAHSLLRRSTHKKCRTSNDGSIFSRKKREDWNGLGITRDLEGRRRKKTA